MPKDTTKPRPQTTRPRFKVGDSALFIGLGCYDIPGDTYGPFPVTKVKDMTGYAGWEDGSQLVYVKGLPLPHPDDQFVPVKRPRIPKNPWKELGAEWEKFRKETERGAR